MYPDQPAKDLDGMASRETPRRGDERRIRDAAGAAKPLEAADKVPIFHQRYRAKSAEHLVDPAANKDPRVAVIEPEQPDPRAKPGQPLAEFAVTVKDETKISAHDVRVRRQHLVYPSECAAHHRAVGVQKEQYVAASRLGAERHPGAAAGAGEEGLRSAIARHLERPVATAAIHDDNLVDCLLLKNGVEQARKRGLFVQSRD